MKEKTMKYAVDIPNINDIPAPGEDCVYVNVQYFDKRKDAIEFAQKFLGADKQGKIQTVTKIG